MSLNISKTLLAVVLTLPLTLANVAQAAGDDKKEDKKQKKCHVMAAAQTGLEAPKDADKGKKEDPKAKKYMDAYNECMKDDGKMGLPKMM